VLAQTDSGSAVAEGDETNNVTAGAAQVQVERPDLAVYVPPYIDNTTQFQTQTVGSGHAITVDYLITNQGLGDAIQPWTNEVYLSRDTVLDAGDLPLSSDGQTSNMYGTGTIGRIDPVSFTDTGVVIPANTGAGIWHLILKIDSSNKVDETPFTPTS